MQKQALIFGATGAVGSELLGLCLNGDRYYKSTVIARKPALIERERLNWVESEFDALDRLEVISGMAGGDAYCCLGTTIKAAGSQAAFRRVDHDFVLNAADYAIRCGAKRFSMVSAIGANPDSRSFYTRTKGEVETALMAMHMPCLQIFRPSLLRGQRDEFRFMESIGNIAAKMASPLFRLGFGKYQPVDISKVANAMYQIANEPCDGHIRIVESDEIQRY